MTYDFTPKRNIKAPAALSLALFVGALALFCVAGYGIGPVALLQLLGTVFGAAAIFLLVKFVVLGYIFRVEEKEEGGADFYVIEASAKKRRTLCLISLGDVKETFELADGKLKSKPEGCGKVYNFCPELFPRRAVLLVVDDGDGRYAIKLPYDAEMTGMIKKHAGK